jgi:hypothetical protein
MVVVGTDGRILSANAPSPRSTYSPRAPLEQNFPPVYTLIPAPPEGPIFL